MLHPKTRSRQKIFHYTFHHTSLFSIKIIQLHTIFFISFPAWSFIFLLVISHRSTSFFSIYRTKSLFPSLYLLYWMKSFCCRVIYVLPLQVVLYCAVLINTFIFISTESILLTFVWCNLGFLYKVTIKSDIMISNGIKFEKLK